MSLKNGSMKVGRKESTLVMIKRMPREGSQKEEETKEKKKIIAKSSDLLPFLCWYWFKFIS